MSDQSLHQGHGEVPTRVEDEGLVWVDGYIVEGSLAMGVAHFTTREHGNIPGSGNQFPGKHVEVQGCEYVASPLISYGILEICLQLLPVVVFKRASPAPWPDGRVEMALMAAAWVTQQRAWVWES